MAHICVGNLTIIGSDNGLSPDRRQAITWTNVGILLIGPLGTNFSEMLIEIHTFSFKKIHLKISSGKWRPFCLGLNALSHTTQVRCNFKKRKTIKTLVRATKVYDHIVKKTNVFIEVIVLRIEIYPPDNPEWFNVWTFNLFVFLSQTVYWLTLR